MKAVFLLLFIQPIQYYFRCHFGLCCYTKMSDVFLNIKVTAWNKTLQPFRSLYSNKEIAFTSNTKCRTGNLR